MSQTKRPAPIAECIDGDGVQGNSPYKAARARFGDDQDSLYEYLREHRLEHPSLCLGFYLLQALRERHLNQADIAGLTGTKTEQPITRSFISAILGAATRAKPENYIRLSNALEANPIEFYIAEGWITTSDIAAYSVPSPALLLPIAKKLEQIRPEYRQAASALVSTMIDTALLQMPRLKV